MTHLIVTDLQQDKALDTAAMMSIKGGFGGYGEMAALSAPLYTPVFGAVNDISKGLANINTQLNISVLNFGGVQNNDNAAFQF